MQKKWSKPTKQLRAPNKETKEKERVRGRKLKAVNANPFKFDTSGVSVLVMMQMYDFSHESGANTAVFRTFAAF